MRQEFLSKSASVFESSDERKKEKAVDTEVLYSKIGKLEMEPPWHGETLGRTPPKKKLAQNQSVAMKRILIDPTEELSIREQCNLLQLNRASFYYSPRGEKEENLKMMRLMAAAALMSTSWRPPRGRTHGGGKKYAGYVGRKGL